MPALLLLLLLLAPPAVPQDALQAARALRREGRPEEAVALVEAALRAHPDDAELVGMLGVCLLDAGRRARAEALADQWADYDGDNHQVFVFLGRVAQARQDAETALTCYRRALDRNPRALEAQLGIIGTFMGTGRYGKALHQARQLQDLDAALGARCAADALAAQGDAYARASPETLPLAADKYLAALELEPDDGRLAERALDTLIVTVHLDQAARLIDELYPRDSADWQLWTGRRLAAAQEPEAARAAFQEARRLDPGLTEAAIQLARLALDAGELEQARSWLEAAGEQDGSPRQALLAGEVATELGDLPAAERHLRAALALDADNPKALYGLGRVLLRQDRREAGQALLQRFADLQNQAARAVAEDP